MPLNSMLSLLIVLQSPNLSVGGSSPENTPVGTLLQVNGRSSNESSSSVSYSSVVELLHPHQSTSSWKIQKQHQVHLHTSTYYRHTSNILAVIARDEKVIQAGKTAIGVLHQTSKTYFQQRKRKKETNKTVLSL